MERKYVTIKFIRFEMHPGGYLLKSTMSMDILKLSILPTFHREVWG
jgi:hypothetical protein